MRKPRPIRRFFQGLLQQRRGARALNPMLAGLHNSLSYRDKNDRLLPRDCVYIGDGKWVIDPIAAEFYYTDRKWPRTERDSRQPKGMPNGDGAGWCQSCGAWSAIHRGDCPECEHEWLNETC